jgi:hypothetical protein
MLSFYNYNYDLIVGSIITKLPNSEHSYKGKVKTHNYINRQNLFGPKVCFLAQMVCHLKEKRKAALHSLTQSYVTVLI